MIYKFAQNSDFEFIPDYKNQNLIIIASQSDVRNCFDITLSKLDVIDLKDALIKILEDFNTLPENEEIE